MADDVGTALAAELDTALQVERAKKGTVEAKGISIITTSGGLVTLLFGLVTIATGKNTLSLHGATAGFLFAGIIFLAIASVLGLCCNLPGKYLEIDSASLLSMTTLEEWTSDGAEARRELALARIRVVSNWRDMNNRRTRILIAAFGMEAAGVTSIAVAAVIAAAQLSL